METPTNDQAEIETTLRAAKDMEAADALLRETLKGCGNPKVANLCSECCEAVARRVAERLASSGLPAKDPERYDACARLGETFLQGAKFEYVNGRLTGPETKVSFIGKWPEAMTKGVLLKAAVLAYRKSRGRENGAGKL